MADSKKTYTTSKKETASKNNKENTSKSGVKTSGKNVAPSTNKVLKLVLFLVLIFIMGVLLTILIYNRYNLLQYSEFDLSVKIENGSSSFNTSTEGLNFARMYPGGEVTKRIDIRASKKSLVHIAAVGNIASFISVSENNFVLEPEDYKQVEVYLTLPIDALEGPYNGTLQIYFYRK